VGMRQFWEKLTSRRYVGALEAEVARLRMENRALLNSILGIAGVPPISVANANVDGQGFASRMGAGENSNAALRGRPGNGSGPGAQQLAPMRRRSWQQITRALEFESAKQADATSGTAAATAPARQEALGAKQK
jgi:hypothetical protein